MSTVEELRTLLKERDERIEQLIIENESKKAAMEELFSELEHLSNILEVKTNETKELQMELARLRKTVLAPKQCALGSSTQMTPEQTTLGDAPFDGSSLELSAILGQVPPPTAAVPALQPGALVVSGLELMSSRPVNPVLDFDDSGSLRSTAQDSVELMRSKSSIRSYEQQQQQRKEEASSSRRVQSPSLAPSRRKAPSANDVTQQELHSQGNFSSEPSLFERPAADGDANTGFSTPDQNEKDALQERLAEDDKRVVQEIARAVEKTLALRERERGEQMNEPFWGMSA